MRSWKTFWIIKRIMEKTEQQKIEKLQTRIEYLEDSRRFVQNVLEMVLKD